MSLLRKTHIDYIKKAFFNNQGKGVGGDNDDQKNQNNEQKNQAHYCQENFQISSGASQETSFQLQNPNIDLRYSPDYFLAF